MLRNIVRTLLRVPNTRPFVTAPTSTIFTQQRERLADQINPYTSPFLPEHREVWLENLDTEETNRLALIQLHSEVFADTPRIDLIKQNVQWQKMYRYVSFANSKTRAEKRGGGNFQEIQLISAD
jgi:hypothetical protein